MYTGSSWIRGVKASASLKPLIIGLLGGQFSMRIRGVKASASLKLRHYRGIRKRRMEDPRCKSLGLIEAEKADAFLIGRKEGSEV